ncbi:Karyopherin functions in nuclear transport of protein [Spathaspora passalidarum NRRL Y-27907]|uniref:Karyopherin functions in nuclear transport of protein n=1 Tax=Spathaspora passalidarum (strain NRRL Y-27907 / 11-Y1) TaxID=619300 RepID=G3ATL6_SPAPN|nr:Karyopherin functions in nuclear transport of protein [Spathaspora passalidarum NRRL Y-27907]EGW30979.1 Karyopherin functions in nuclear transport of protein [Spathaspora passalidarum NRRL Y-27907]
MSLLPEDVQAVLAQLLENLSSADNAIRSAAEKSLDNEWTIQANVEMLLVFLAEQSCMGSNDTIRSFAAVLFRRIAIKSPRELSSVTDRTIGVTSEPVRAQIRSILLKGFTSQQSNQVRHKLSDAISEVAKEDASPAGSWNELIPTLFEATRNPDPSFRESAFRVFSATPELIDKSYLNDVLPVFNSGFEDQTDDVRIAACTAFVAFFRELPKKNWQSLSPLLPNLLNSLPRFLQNGQDQALALVLESLIDLVELAPKMFKDMFPTIIDFCAAVSKNKDLESNTRMASLELLTTFAEVSPSMCKRTPSYTEQMVLITLSMLTEVCIDDDDAAEWNNNDDTEDEDEEPEHDAARQALDRTALRLNGQALAAPLFQYLPAMIQSANWRERQAALMALSSAAEGCADVLMNEIPKILDLILPTLNDDHPRVQYACCNALGQMSTDFADVIQRTAGNKILPALISKLTNKSVPRVQSHAAAALVNFSEAASKEILEPYLDDLLSNLLGLLQSPKRYVQEQVLTTIAIIADAAEKTFIKYYDTLMPLLTDVLKTDMGDENRLLKAKCIECATLIALAVGKEKFAPHCQDLIQLFGHIQETATQDDDPVKQYLEQAWGRICRIIGKDFIPYLPSVLPPLLTSAKATQDISLLEEEQAEEFNSNEEWDVINLSGKLIAVHTAALDEKVAAIDLLRTYAIQLKGDFFPWVKEIIEDIAIPGLDFYLHDGVRGSAALTLASLLKCSVVATGNNSTETLVFWSKISEKLVEVLTNEPVPELLVAYYTALVECITVLGPNSLSSPQLDSLAKSINTNLVEICERIKARDNEDDEYTEDVEEDEDEYTDEELLDEINKALSSIFKNSQANFLPHFQILIPTVASFINDENTNIKLCGLCVVCDILEHCGPNSVIYRDMFANVVAESITSPHASIRQASSYAVGVAAQFGGEDYAQFCLACLEPMFKMASVPDARAEENIHATENSVSAIAKICHRFSSTIPNLNTIIDQWITLLPIVQDESAAPFAYMFLSELIENNHPSINNQIPKVVDSVIQALAHASIAGATAERVVAATRQLLGSVPHSEAIALLQKNPADIDIVQKYFS